MLRLAVACVVLAGCGEELAAPALPACSQQSGGHWDGRFVSPGAAGASRRVTALQRMPDGSVVAGGSFDAMSGVTARNIARWDGARWTALGDGLPGEVRSLTVDDAGQLWAVGEAAGLIDDAALLPISGSYVARWSGTQWTYELENVFSIGRITAIDGGVAIAGSFFEELPRLPASGVALWRDGRWSGTGLTNGGSVTSIVRDGTGVCVGGTILPGIKLSMTGLACWDGTEWTQRGETLGAVQTIARGTDGTWYAGGTLQLVEDGNARYGIARLDENGHWRSLDGGIHPREVTPPVVAPTPEVAAISITSDGLVVVGQFEWAGVPKQRAYHLARWSAATGWSAMLPPSDLFGRLDAVLATGEHTFVGGSFAQIGALPGAAIATIDAGAVHSLPETTLAPPTAGVVSDLVEGPDGMILAGRFDPGDMALPAASLVHFDGTWTTPNEGLPADVPLVAVALPDGLAVRTATQLFRRFAGDRWQLVTDRVVSGPLVVDGAGRLLFTVTETNRWSIASTTRGDTSFYASAPGPVLAMAIHDGDLVIVTANERSIGESVYRRRDEEWELMGAWPDATKTLVSSPALGLVVGTDRGTRVWTGAEWRTISQAPVQDMAACSDGVVAVIDEGAGGQLVFRGASDEDWRSYGEPRPGQFWQLAPTAHGIYTATSSGGSGGFTDAPLGFARWTTSDDTGW